MLHVWEIQDRTQISGWLEKLDLARQTWLLSDLRTKFEIQDLFIKKNGFFLEDSVLRISDLWKKILQRSHPHCKVMTQQAAILHLRYFLRQHGESIGLPESSENTLLKWMGDLAPFYFHPQGEERLNDWFAQNSDQEQSWKEWWLRSKLALSYFKNKNQLLAQWIPSFLQSLQEVSAYWEKDLIVDLSGQLSFVEAELLQLISKRQEITIIAPFIKDKNANSKYADLLYPYEYLKGFAQTVKKVEVTDTPNQREYLSFTSTLGSIRQAVATVRKWIEDGVKLDRIALVAADIEALWPVLSFHLETEGIPVNKSQMNPLQSTVAVQYFLSKLRTLNYNLSTRDLELTYYGQEKSDLVFERFEAIYKNIYDESDYGRLDKVKKSLQTSSDIKQPMNQAQFIFQLSKLSLQPHTHEIPKWLESLVRDILGSFDDHFTMPWSDWISFCESSMSRQEVQISEGVRDGIMVTNLMSAHFLSVTHRIFIELSEENLKAKSDRGIMPQAARKISRDLGFWLNHAEKGDAEFELEWALQCGTGLDHFYFSATNIVGQLMTPSSVWLKAKNQDNKGADHGIYKTPEKTVLDRILNKNWNSEVLLEETGEIETADLNSDKKNQVLSPSAMESFYKCPFTYYARQTLGLKTFPEVDLDLDRRSAGEALHHLFETILQRGLTHWTDQQLDKLLEDTRESHFSGVVGGLWLVQKKKMLKLCQRFIQFESEWRRAHPQLKETKTEVTWSGKFADSQFRGRIDRVDVSAKNELIVLDYKLSGSQLKGAHQWIENGSLQMLFYIYALEHGWVEGLEGQVVAAFYFVIKNFSRETGFEQDQEIPGFLQHTTKKNQKFSLEKKSALINDFESLVKDLTARLQKGEIKPIPQDEKNCSFCEWRRLCRAPHLI